MKASRLTRAPYSPLHSGRQRSIFSSTRSTSQETRGAGGEVSSVMNACCCMLHDVSSCPPSACRRHPTLKPLDLSSVVDVRDPNVEQRCRAQGVAVQHLMGQAKVHAVEPSASGVVLHPPGSTLAAPDPGCSMCRGQGHLFREAYTLPAHPGFVLLPGALSAPQQLSLACNAFLRLTFAAVHYLCFAVLQETLVSM